MDAVLSTAAAVAVRQWHQRLLDLIGVLSVAMQGERTPPPWGHFSSAVRGHVAAAEADLFPTLDAVLGGRVPADAAARLRALGGSLDAVRTLADTLRVAAREAGLVEDQLLALLDELEVQADAEAQLIAGALRSITPRRSRQAPRVHPGTPSHPPHLRGGLLRRALRLVLG